MSEDEKMGTKCTDNSMVDRGKMVRYNFAYKIGKAPSC